MIFKRLDDETIDFFPIVFMIQVLLVIIALASVIGFIPYENGINAMETCVSEGAEFINGDCIRR